MYAKGLVKLSMSAFEVPTSDTKILDEKDLGEAAAALVQQLKMTNDQEERKVY